MPVKRRRLLDLYVLGREATIGEDTGDPEKIWLQKLNPVHNEDATRRANAMRARARAAMKNKDSEEYLEARQNVEEFSNRDMLINMAIAEELRQIQAKVEAEVAAEDEWSTDDYLQSIVDAWEGSEDNPGLKERWIEDKDDPEAARVKGEMDRFDARVKELVDQEVEGLRKDWDGAEDDRLLEEATTRVLEQRALSAFIVEYENWQIFYAVRFEDAHSEQYFKNIEEVRALEDKTKDQILAEYRKLMVEPQEGKGSEETPDSSPSSEPSVEGETSPSSGPAVARL